MKIKSYLPIFLLLVLISSVILGAFLIIKHSQNSIENGTSGKITNGMVLKTYHQIAIDNGNITIGKANSTGLMKPEVTLSKLDGEASMNISYPIGPNIKAAAQTNTIIWNDKNQDLYFKQASSDKFEFDILLKEKPNSNVFTYHIDATGLDFFYQPPLAQTNKDPNLTCSETECRDKNGNLIDSRPENVVGSYAVYYKDGKSGDYSKAGGKNYQTGKAFHIYRPQITDAKGQKIWGQLAVNPDNGTLTVTVDPTFLATASYPVTVDPTLGNTHAGASATSINNYVRGSYSTMTETGTPLAISAYIYNGACLTGNTPVTMADGSFKKIKDIQIGDKILSFNETTKVIEPDTVTKLISYTADQMGEYYLTITTDDGKKIEVTPDHLTYVGGQWIEAGKLQVGDILLNSQNQNIQIVSIEKVYNQVPVYNFEVKNNHDYFANFLVHNAIGSGTIKGAIYNQSDSSFIVGSSEVGMAGGATGWMPATGFVAPPALSASTNYWLFIWGTTSSANINLYYDSGGNGGFKALTFVGGGGSTGWPGPISGLTTDSNLYSVYITYTASATPTPVPTPAIKIGPGVKILSGTCIKGGGGSNPCLTPTPIPTPTPTPWTCGSSLVDTRDSQSYPTVLIGSQCWMAKNLNYSTSGTYITGATTQTNNSSIEKYCYSNTASYCTTYGGLYQFPEAVQYLNGETLTASWSPVPSGNVQGICPTGWHIPTDAEWTTLSNAYGGDSVSGGPLKETGTTHWVTPNTGATNTSGFTGLPGGYGYAGSFYYVGSYGLFWAATEYDASSAWYRYLAYNNATVTRNYYGKTGGFSVRCLKD